MTNLNIPPLSRHYLDKLRSFEPDKYRQESRQMPSKILATFRCDPDLWQRFKALAALNETNASALLLQFIDWYLAGNTLPDQTSACLDRCLDDKLDSNLGNYLDHRLATMLDKRLDKNRATTSSVEDALKSIWERLEFIEGTVAGEVASLRAEHHAQRLQQIAPQPSPDWERIRERILNSLGVGKQAKLYKKVRAEFDRIIL